jgi:acyl-CoA synthetase (AMP-forming)/AMP-acid ligase II
LTAAERTWTFAELDARVDAVTRGLTASGVRGPDRVALMSDNRPELLLGFLGVFRAGACLVPLNAQLTAEEFTYQLSDSGATTLLHSDRFADIAADVPDAILPASMDGAQAHWFEPSHRKAPAPEVTLDSAAWLFYTSGTTGLPKGATLTHRNLVAVVSHWLADLERMDPTDRLLHVAPLTHGAGFQSLVALAAGAHQFLLPDGFDAARVLDALRRLEITRTWMVPTHIRLLLDHRGLLVWPAVA